MSIKRKRPDGGVAILQTDPYFGEEKPERNRLKSKKFEHRVNLTEAALKGILNELLTPEEKPHVRSKRETRSESAWIFQEKGKTQTECGVCPTKLREQNLKSICESCAGRIEEKINNEIYH